jgi:glutathione S-transferase
MIKFYKLWFCPYAQRAWIALNHLDVEYEPIEADTVMPDGSTEKSNDLLNLNPKGTVPTLYVVENGDVVTGSIEAIQYLNKHYNRGSDDFASEDLVKEAHAANEKLVSTFFGVLFGKTKGEQDEVWKTFITNLEKFTKNVQADGFYKSPTMNIVDIIMFPVAYRMFMLQEFRGKTLDETLPWRDDYIAWYQRMLEMTAVSSTNAERADLRKQAGSKLGIY